MPQGSPFWQGILLFAGILFLAWETWRGWRAGVIRSGLQLAAIVVASLAGWAAAWIAALPFGGLGEIGGGIAGLLVGAGVGLLVFVACWLLTALLFKRTEHQRSGILRLLWGAGGGAFGFLLGLLVLWGGISCIRAMGSLAQARLQSAHVGEDPSVKPPALASGLVTLKESLELGPAGKVVQSLDALPPDFYELIVLTGRISSDQEALLKFMEYPGVQQVLEHPRMAAVINDPETIKAAQTGNILRIMNTPAVLAAVQDPTLTAELRKIDVREALRFAVGQPAPSPVPSPGH